MRKRAKWRKGFDGSNNGSVRSLAEHVKAQPDDDIKKLFSHKTTDFEDALEDLLGDDPHGHLGSLTDTELAYCAGWCLLAELEHGADIAAIKDKIQEQIDNLHMLDDGVGPYSG